MGSSERGEGEANQPAVTNQDPRIREGTFDIKSAQNGAVEKRDMARPISAKARKDHWQTGGQSSRQGNSCIWKPDGTGRIPREVALNLWGVSDAVRKSIQPVLPQLFSRPLRQDVLLHSIPLMSAGQAKALTKRKMCTGRSTREQSVKSPAM